MDDITNILRAWIMIFSLILFIVSMVAYYRTRNKRVLFVSIAFAIFFVKGIVLSLGLINPEIETYYTSGVGDFLDLMILILLAATILKK
jgi:hypothetical protein